MRTEGTPRQPSHRAGERIDGRFRVKRLLGRGMSEVFEVFDERLNVERALKIVPRSGWHDQEQRARLLREAEVTRRIDHPNVVHVCHVSPGEVRAPYFTMELLKGETLRQLLERDGCLPTSRALEVIREAAEGLAAAHAMETIHRDVKPDNLFLCGEPGKITGIKVLDFGLAQQSDEESPGIARNHVMGTAEYMAPEQVVADPADARSDVYALGVVLFRLITRELPFDLVSPQELLAHHLASIPPPPSWLVEQLDEGIDALVASTVRKSPANRYPNMKLLLEDIDRVRSGRRAHGVELRQTPDRYEPRSQLGRDALNLLTRHHTSAPPPRDP